MIDIIWMASPVEKSTGDATFQNWRAAGETSRSFHHDPPPFCFSCPRAPSVSLSSGLLRIYERLGASLAPLIPWFKTGFSFPNLFNGQKLDVFMKVTSFAFKASCEPCNVLQSVSSSDLPQLPSLSVVSEFLT